MENNQKLELFVVLSKQVYWGLFVLSVGEIYPLRLDGYICDKASSSSCYI